MRETIVYSGGQLRCLKQTRMSDLVGYITTLPPEQEAIRAKCFHPTRHFEEFAKEDVEQSVPERFEKTVKRHADRIAIKETGLVEYRFAPDRFEVRHVRAAGQLDIDIEELFAQMGGAH